MSFTEVADLIREAERHADDGADERIRAVDYYRGVMADMKPDANRSAAVSRDLRANIKKALPSIIRTILGNDEVVEFQPKDQGDEESAQQASDYINYVVMPEGNGWKVLYDAAHDALLLRNGILKWWWDEKQVVKFSDHSGLTEMELGQLLADGDSEIVEQSSTVENIQGPDGQVMPVELFDVKLRRSFTESKACFAAVPRDRFLIHPDATSLDDSLVTGEKQELRRSDLVAMGYDRDKVMSLTLADDNEEANDRGENRGHGQETSKANQLVDYYEVFVRIDMDDDGISELRKMCFAGDLKEENLLADDEVDEVQFADLTAMPQPHQWEGVSLSDDLIDIQRVKTALLRQTLDNIYHQNNQQPVVDLSAVVNPEAVMEPKFGEPIILKAGRSAREVMEWANVPFVAPQAFQMLEYLDAEATDRTGISDASAGMAPDALQNMTATASAMIEQGGIGQTEMMVRSLAHGLGRFYKGLLRLIVRHQDKARTVRLRDQWVEFDPRHWNAEMDAVVNVGLGAGTRERDMAVMQVVLGLQEKLVASFGADNPFVKPEQLYSALAKTIEAAGLKTPSLFFTEPDPQEIAAKMAASKNKPDPEMQKAQAEMALKKADMEGKMQLERAKMEAAKAKEKAQMDADLIVKGKEIEAETARQRDRLAADAALAELNIGWEREKQANEIAARREEAGMKLQAERINQMHRAQMAAQHPQQGVKQ